MQLNFAISVCSNQFWNKQDPIHSHKKTVKGSLSRCVYSGPEQNLEGLTSLIHQPRKWVPSEIFEQDAVRQSAKQMKETRSLSRTYCTRNEYLRHNKSVQGHLSVKQVYWLTIHRSLWVGKHPTRYPFWSPTLHCKQYLWAYRSFYGCGHSQFCLEGISCGRSFH